MKLRIGFLSAVFCLVMAGCNVDLSLDKFVKPVEDVSGSASDLMNRINEVVRLIDGKMESGDFDREVGALLDQRLANVTALIENAMQNTGGYFFAQANGTVDNAFANIRQVIDQLQTGVLNNSVPKLLDQLSGQLQLQLTTISGALEELVVMTSDNVVYVVDKTVNGLVVTISVIALVVGLILFIVIMILMRRSLNAANIIGIGFMGVFTVFFLVMTLSPTVRGKVISGFDFSAKKTMQKLSPTVTSVIPEQLTLGTSKNVYIYGRHLNLLKNPAVALFQGPTKIFSFPPKTLVVATANRIVLGNFGENLNWNPVTYGAFSAAAAPRLQSAGITDAMVQSALKRAPAVTAPRFNALVASRMTLAQQALGAGKAQALLDVTAKTFAGVYKISEGEYALSVFNDTARIESPQYFVVANPPPPAKLPDITCTDIRWSGNLAPVVKQDASLDIDLVIDNAQEVKNPFSINITTVPVTKTMTVKVPTGKIALAQQNGGKITITSSQQPFQGPASGGYAFKVSIDDNNEIPEINKANNTFSKNLRVYEYKFSAAFNSFQLEQPSCPGSGTTTIVTTISASSGSTAKCTDVIKNSSNRQPFKCSANLDYLPVGTVITVSFYIFQVWTATVNPAAPPVTGANVISNDVLPPISIVDGCTDNHDTKDIPIGLTGKNCKLSGICSFTRVKD